MNASRVGELVDGIQKAEAELVELKARAAELEARFVARTGELAAFKRELASELKAFLPGGEKKSRAPRAPRAPGAAPSEGGVRKTDVVRAFFADGLEHTSKDVNAMLAEKGLKVSNLAVLMGNLVKGGEVVRVGRGSFRKA